MDKKILKNLYINRDHLYSICMDTATGEYYLEVVVSHSFATYSMYCLITDEEYNNHKVNQEEIINLVNYVRYTKWEEVEKQRVIKRYIDFCIEE